MSRLLTAVPIGGAIDPAEELRRVMTEVAEALGGAGTVLTIHPPDQPPRIVRLDVDPDFRDGVERLLESGALDYRREHEDHHRWVPGPFGRYAPEALAMPVRQVPGHSRLMVTVFFDTLEAEHRAAAERAYLERRPFAVGYFRLWQQEQLRTRELSEARAALDRVGTAVVLVERSGQIAFANHAARRLMSDGNALCERGGRLCARERADNIALETAVDHVIHGDPAAAATPVLRLHREGSTPLVTAVLPASSPATEQGEVAALVFAVDPDMDIRPLTLPVCRAFNLTRVETELASELSSGLSLTEAAHRLRMKDATARSHLRVIFSKTGTNRQADLVRMILVSLVRALEPGSAGIPA